MSSASTDGVVAAGYLTARVRLRVVDGERQDDLRGEQEGYAHHDGVRVIGEGTGDQGEQEERHRDEQLLG